MLPINSVYAVFCDYVDVLNKSTSYIYSKGILLYI